MRFVEVGNHIVDGIPQNHEQITGLLMERLRSSGLRGKLPTDLDVLIGDAGMKTLEEDPSKLESFLSEMPEWLQSRFKYAKNRTRGAFGFRRKEIYVAKQGKSVYELFPKAHEYTHGALPWHDMSYMDDSVTLSRSFEEQREREANFGAGQVIFQGDDFRDRVIESDESLESGLVIAAEYGATNSSTLWRYAEVHDRQVVLLSYPNKRGNRLFRAVGSQSFCAKRRGLLVPSFINVDHEWYNRPLADLNIKQGDGHMTCDGDRVKVRWESWSNGYCQFVFIAVISKLHTVGQILNHPVRRLVLPRWAR